MAASFIVKLLVGSCALMYCTSTMTCSFLLDVFSSVGMSPVMIMTGHWDVSRSGEMDTPLSSMMSLRS